MGKKRKINVKNASKKKQADISMQDKIARLYALAEKLHVKIGG